MSTYGSKTSVLIRLVQLKIARGFRSRPAENDGDIIDERCLGQFAERVLVILYVHHGKKDAKVIFALQVPYASVDVLGMKTVVLETIQQLRSVQYAWHDGVAHLRKRAHVVKPRT